MAVDPEDDVLLKCINHPCIEEHNLHQEIFISTSRIFDWDLPTILAYPIANVRANRSRLIEDSSYFRALLSGNFSESGLDYISVQWNLETIINLVKTIHCCPLVIDFNNFLPLFEGALFFGVEKLLSKCKAWFSEMTSPKRPSTPQCLLNDLIHIWKFGLEHADDFIPEQCTCYLARNFMWTMSSVTFGDVPYDLLFSCLKHPDLTVYSEKDLCNALLAWIGANRRCSGYGFPDILKQVRKSLLPLWFSAGKRSCCFLSDLANESYHMIVSLTKCPFMDPVNDFGDGDLQHLRIRLTEYSKKVDLSSCPHITVAILLTSVLPCPYVINPKLWKNFQLSSIIFGDLDRDKHTLSKDPLPILSFSAVQEVDISKCPRLHLEAAVQCLCKSFPSLKILKAAYFGNFSTQNLCQLLQKFPLLSEVDLTVDISPVIPTQVSVVYSSSAEMLHASKLYLSLEDSGSRPFSMTRPLFPNITKITLEGRNDVSDSDLQAISERCVSLCYLNLNGCISVTDVGISVLLSRCTKLCSIFVCDTSFGTNSVMNLCVEISSLGSYSAEQLEKKAANSLAFQLEELDLGGCKGVDEASLHKLFSQMHMLKSLCMRGTNLVNDALLAFPCSSLKSLDVSDTMVSGRALAQVVGKNYMLRSLKARGCTNLLEQASGGGCFPYSFNDLHSVLGKVCKLDEIAIGWGFSCFSLEVLKPAIGSLRAISVGLGGSLGYDCLALLPTTCPFLESIILHFQVISDSIIRKFVESFRALRVLELCRCLGDISSLSLHFSLPSLRKLKLERVTPWMTNDDLIILSNSCKNLAELSLVGCTHLNSGSQRTITYGWPGLVSLSLEDCGEITANGVATFLECKALEDLLLRHNGHGIRKSFILDAAIEMPMLRRISLDLCDATEGDFHLPDAGGRRFLSAVKISRCKSQGRGLSLSMRPENAGCRRVHVETLVWARDSRNITTTVVRERL